MGMTMSEINQAIQTAATVKDFDGETGVPVETDTDGETTLVLIQAENFARWSDSMDLTLV